jgi:phage terminase large subunit
MTAEAVRVQFTDVIGPAYYEMHHAIKRGEVWEIWLPGGRDSLKSSTVACECLMGMQADPELNTIAMRRYASDIEKSVFSTFQWAARKLGVYDMWQWLSSPFMARNKQTGQIIRMLGADDPESTKSIAWPKGRTGFFWPEEITQFRGSDDLRSIRQSVIRGKGNIVSFFTFNPPKSPRNWANAEVRQVEAMKNPRYMVLRTNYLQVNPDWLGEQAIALAENLKITDELRWRNEYMAEVVGTGVEVFNNIELREMDDDEIAALPNVRQGLDWGYAVDPVCLERMAYDRKRRILYLTGEISGIRKGNRDLNEETPELWKRELSKADSSEPKTIDEMRETYGWNIRAATKGPGSVETGVKWLADLAKIVIDPRRCPLAAREFPDYALDADRAGNIISRYPDRDNHSIDATRYGCEDLMIPEQDKKPIAAPLPIAGTWRR